ncbi:MAG: TolC family protein [Methylococcales bacterium]|nr:TolC family protein [Methylococcales bacterium]
MMLTNQAAVLLLLILPSALYAETKTLVLGDVLSAAEKSFPALLAAEQRRIATEGDYISSQGAFDTVVKSQNRWSVIGLYENQNYDVSVEQPTPYWGTTFFGGWRRGTGDYPIYDGKNITATDGEYRVGMNVPLWRNREIDRRRAGLKQAELAQLIAGHDIDQALLDIRRQAAHRYWDWVLVAQRLLIVEHLLQVAEERNAGILERVAAGDIPQFEALDNQRAIIERQERRVAAQRMLEQSAIQLSLYWRNENGEPLIPVTEQLPKAFPQEPNVETDFNKAWAQAQEQRPELKRLGVQAEQTATELALQKNQQAPAIDLSVVGALDNGKGKSGLNRDELYVGLNFDFPIQQRTANGKAQAATANLQRLKWESNWAENRIAADIQDALSRLAAARQRLTLIKKQQKAAEELEKGERERFDLGESNILFVNMRELATGDAAIMAIEASSNLFKAHADYLAALGTHAEGN